MNSLETWKYISLKSWEFMYVSMQENFEKKCTSKESLFLIQVYLIIKWGSPTTSKCKHLVWCYHHRLREKWNEYGSQITTEFFFFSFKSQMLFENIKLDNWKRISFALIIWRHDNMSLSFWWINCTLAPAKAGY